MKTGAKGLAHRVRSYKGRQALEMSAASHGGLPSVVGGNLAGAGLPEANPASLKSKKLADRGERPRAQGALLQWRGGDIDGQGDHLVEASRA